MNLDNYEQETDIEINTPADIYRAMLDGCVAGFKSTFINNCSRFENGSFVLNEGEHPKITQDHIEKGYWTLWREKPKPKWWELVSQENPFVVRSLIFDTVVVLYGLHNIKRENYEPLTDAEIDQLKRGF